MTTVQKLCDVLIDALIGVGSWLVIIMLPDLIAWALEHVAGDSP